MESIIGSTAVRNNETTLSDKLNKISATLVPLPIVLTLSLASGNAASADITELSQQLRTSIEDHPNGQSLENLQLPDSDDFANIPQDPSNPITAEKVQLGKLLFHDTATGTQGTEAERLETWSCASCHHVAAGFKAGIPQGIADGGVGFGMNGEGRRLGEGLDATAEAGSSLLPDLQPIASPTVLNTAFQDLMLWNGSFGNVTGGNNESVATVDGAGPPPIQANTFGLSGLETQVLAGTNVHRLGFDADSILQTNEEYSLLFDQAFPGGNTGTIPDNGTTVTVTALGAAKAIAAYERTILSNLAPFQRWLSGEENAMNEQQLRGGLLFFGKADCASCHTGPALSSRVGASNDEMFFALGFNDLDSSNPLIHGVVDDATQRGRGGFTGDPTDDYKFKIPPLYNLTDAPVLGHGASFSSVREVVEYKNAAVPQNPAAVNNLSDRFLPLELTDTEITDLVVFLEEGLHDASLDRYVPSKVPSGNCIPVSDVQSVIDLGCLADDSLPTIEDVASALTECRINDSAGVCAGSAAEEFGISRADVWTAFRLNSRFDSETIELLSTLASELPALSGREFVMAANQIREEVRISDGRGRLAISRLLTNSEIRRTAILVSSLNGQ